MKKILILLPLFFFIQLCFAEIYKWVDDDGHVHFTDTPPQHKQSKKVTVKVNTYSQVKVILPEKPVAKIKKEAIDKNVIIYSAEWCGVCRKAKRYFKEKGIPYTEYDIDKTEEARQKYSQLNARGVPVIFVDDVRLNGFSQAHFEEVYYN